jgi:hypothetical protein
MHSLRASRGVHSCHLFSRGRRWRGKIDFAFYQRRGDRAVHVTNAAPEHLWSRVLDAADHLLDPEHVSRPRYRRRLHRWYHEAVAPRAPERVQRGLRQLVDALCLRNCASGRRVIYEYPARHFETRVLAHFLGVDVRIPCDVTDYLRLAYGADWQTPKRFVNWYEGATRIEE